METLQNLLTNINPYALAFKQMSNIEQQKQGEPLTVWMTFKRGPAQRRYNEPRFDEVAAIFV
jgi:hypothetical protein